METATANPPTEYKKVHYSWPQRRGALVRASIEVFVASRGFGKSYGVFAERVSHNVFAMPLSLTGLMTPNYKSFFTKFVIPFKAGLKALGYEPGRDYVIGDEGPASWPRPHNSPEDWGYGMHWRCGSGTVFIGQDGKGAGNGYNLDAIHVDEAKLINGPKFEDETVPTLRGNKNHYGHQSEHHSVFICSDRPVTQSEKWFYSYRNQVTPKMEEGVRLIMQLQMLKMEMEEKIESGALASSSVATYTSEINSIDAQMNSIRKNIIYYHEASILDNIDVIGLDKLKGMAKSMSNLKFRTAILNEEIDHVEGGFYQDFDDNIHCYDPQLTSWTTANGYDDARLSTPSSRHDHEIDTDLPLHIAMDYGGNINCMAIAQEFADTIRIDNGLYAIHPELTVDVVNAFTTYYQEQRCKQVYYYYDHTANQGSGFSRFHYSELVMNTLREAEWSVVPIWIGQTPPAHLRYEMFSKLLRQHQSPPVQWNRENCSELITSIRMCQIREGKKGLEKNKSMEGKVPIEYEVQQPHFSDACDTLVWGMTVTSQGLTTLPTPSIMV